MYSESSTLLEHNRRVERVERASEAMRDVLRHNPGPWLSGKLQAEVLASGEHTPISVRSAMLVLRDGGELRQGDRYQLTYSPSK